MLADSYTKALKRYDRDLYASRNMDGVMCVFRRIKTYELVSSDEQFKLYDLKLRTQFVLALTDTWNLKGVPRQWGIDRVVDRIREMDTLSRTDLFDELDKQNERVDESKRRATKNEMEAMLADGRKEFAKAMDEHVGCIHTLSKDEPRKRLKDRSIKNGNY